MKYLCNLLLMLFPAIPCFAQLFIVPYVNLGEVKGSYSTNNVVCASQNNGALLYLTPHLAASGNNWSLESIEYHNGRNPSQGVVRTPYLIQNVFSLKPKDCMNLVVSYIGSEPGHYSMNLNLDCLHGETVCDRTIQVEVDVPEPEAEGNQSALQYIGEVLLPDVRNRLLFTRNQLLAIGDGDPSDLFYFGDTTNFFNLNGTQLIYSEFVLFASGLSSIRPCYQAQDNSIIGNSGSQIRHLTEKGERLKTLKMPSCTDKVELSSKICSEHTYRICRQSMYRIDPASFFTNVTTFQHYPDITLLPGATHYDNHYMNTLLVVNTTHVGIYEFKEGQLTEIATYGSEMRRPTGRQNRARSYGLDADSAALLRVDYEPGQPVEEQRFNWTGVENIQDVAVHESGLVAILHDSRRIRLFLENNVARLTASGVTASLMIILSSLVLF